jgi:hypothetical protein
MTRIFPTAPFLILLILLILLMVLTVGMAFSGCRVLGVQSSECTPGNAETCPPEQFCAFDGYCYFGSDAEGEADAGLPAPNDAGPGAPDAGNGSSAETLATGEGGAFLLVRATDGTLLWVTGGDAGCVRRLLPDSFSPQSLYCAPAGSTLEGLAITESKLAWIRNGADAADSLVITDLVPEADSTADTLSTALEDVGTALEYGPSLLAARSVASDDSFAWPQSPTDTFDGVQRIVVGATGQSTLQTQYGGLNTGGRLGALAFTDDHLFFVTESDLYARVMVRDFHASDDNGGYGAYSDSGENTEYPRGAGFATATCGDTMYVSTRGPNDEGGILKSAGTFSGGFLSVELVTGQVDPEILSAYARGLACDSEALFYTTGGLGTDAPGLFRLSLALDAIPERLLTLDDEGGAVVVDEAFITWAEPVAGAIRRMAKP